ncbi:hypothetical protein ACS0TY_033893 [Phlomoides rotata]
MISNSRINNHINQLFGYTAGLSQCISTSMCKSLLRIRGDIQIERGRRDLMWIPEYFETPLIALMDFEFQRYGN